MFLVAVFVLVCWALVHEVATEMYLRIVVFCDDAVSSDECFLICRRHYSHLKCQETLISQYSLTAQKRVILNYTTVKTSDTQQFTLQAIIKQLWNQKVARHVNVDRTYNHQRHTRYWCQWFAIPV